MLILWIVYSKFSDIFDELHFIKALQEDVRIVKELPKELESAPRARKHFTSWSGMGYYQEMTQLWKDNQVCVVFVAAFPIRTNFILVLEWDPLYIREVLQLS